MNIYSGGRTGNLSASAGTHDDGEWPDSSWWGKTVMLVPLELQEQVIAKGKYWHCEVFFKGEDMLWESYPSSLKSVFLEEVEELLKGETTK